MRHLLAPILSLLCALPAFAAPDARPLPDVTLNEKYQQVTGNDSFIFNITFTEGHTVVVDVEGERVTGKYTITQSPSKGVAITLDKTDPDNNSAVVFHFSIPGAGILIDDRSIVLATAAAKEKAKVLQADFQHLSMAKQLGLGCRLYCGDNDGKYPKQLADLIPTYIPADYFPPLTPQKVFDSIEYLGAGLTDSDNPSKVLLRWKEPTFDGKRIVVYLDGSAKIVPAGK